MNRLQRAMKKAKDDMDYTGINHSNNAKGTGTMLPPCKSGMFDRFKEWWNCPGPQPPVAYSGSERESVISRR